MILDIEQGTEAWRQARVGSLGASSLHEAMARTKTGFSASRANRMAALIIERITGVPQETYQNAAMLHGVETEAEARTAYEFRANVDVLQIGLATHPTLKGTHASPDGLIGSDGVLELKCPQPATHLATLLGEAVPDRYMLQMQWQMRCCDRAWCDFASYCPSFPEAMRLHVRRVPRDDKRIADIERDVTAFLAEVDEKIAALNSRYGEPAANVVKTQITDSLLMAG